MRLWCPNDGVRAAPHAVNRAASERPLTEAEKQALRVSAEHYAAKAQRYAEALSQI